VVEGSSDVVECIPDEGDPNYSRTSGGALDAVDDGPVFQARIYGRGVTDFRSSSTDLRNLGAKRLYVNSRPIEASPNILREDRAIPR